MHDIAPRPSPRLSALDRWLLPAFLLANALCVAALITALGVRAPLYSAIPWIFGAAFGVLLIPSMKGRVVAGSWPWRLGPPLLYAVVISLASSVNPSPTVGTPGNMFHPVEYAGLAFLAQLAWHKGATSRPRWRGIALVCLLCVAFGVLDELHQSLVPHRTSSALDVGLDAIGTLAGTATFLGVAALGRRLTHGARTRPP